MSNRGRGGSRHATALALLVVCLGLGVDGAGRRDRQGDRPRVVDLLDRYERGDHDGVLADFAAVADAGALARELQRRGQAWMAVPQASPAAVERRRLVVAVFTLELAAARLETDWGLLRATVEWACELMRKGQPTRAERVWHLAVVALAGGARDEPLLIWAPPLSSPDPMVRHRHASFVHTDHAARRFPAEVRFRFAEAFANELPGFPEPKRNAPIRVDSINKDRAEAAIQRWKRFVDDAVVGAEAHLRIGHIHYGLGRTREAGAHYEAALTSPGDPFVRYLAYFFTGRMFEAAGRRQDAAGAYRHALAILPLVQSGSMALAATLFLDEKPAEAYALLDAAFAARPRPPDPWRLFDYGDYRLWPDLITQLRTQVRP